MNILPRFERSKMYDPDEPGGTGDPATDPDAGEPTPGTSDLKSVADSIRQAILEARAVTPPAPVIPVSTGASDAARRALEEEGITVNAKFNEMVNAGQAAEAMAMRESFVQKVNRAYAQPAEDSAIVKTAVMLGERAARTEHKDVMSRWGDEVRRAVDALPLEERVLPDAWDKAVSRVKTNHFSELMDEQVNARVAEAKKQFVPPPIAPGSRGARRLEGAAAKLSEEQVWGADLCGVDANEYAKELAREVAYDALPFKERGPFPGYPIVSNDVKPGGF
jgi:hypothetical protein